MDTPKVDDISWHIRYFESSYLMYIGFTTVIISFFVIVYCLKVIIFNKIQFQRNNLTDDYILKYSKKFIDSDEIITIQDLYVILMF